MSDLAPIEAAKLLNLFQADGNAEEPYRQALRDQYGFDNDLTMLTEVSRRLGVALNNFARDHLIKFEARFLEDFMVLPSPKNILVNLALNGKTHIIVSHGFLDLMAFHARSSVCFRMAEILATRSRSDGIPPKKARADLYLSHLAIVGQWLREPFPLDELPASLASPLLLHEEMNVLMMGLLFLLLHERGHLSLGHYGDNPEHSEFGTFNLVTQEHLDGGKADELAADAWAVRALVLSPTTQGWAVTAILRMFLLIGLGQAAIGKISSTHPYVSNRLSHYLSIFEKRGDTVDPIVGEAPLRLAAEYDAWKASDPTYADPNLLLRTVGLFTAAVARAWSETEGDENLATTAGTETAANLSEKIAQD